MAKKEEPAKNPPPKKPKNDDVRGKEYLTEEEVDQLRRTAGALGRHRHRDATMILVAFRHGLRVSELVKLRWDQVDLSKKTVYVRRLKDSKSGLQDLGRTEANALKKLARESKGPQTYVFRNERGGSLTPNAFYKLLQRAGLSCDPVISVHPHMLRHACGYHLINEGHSTRRIQDHLGHRNIQHTERYTELAPDRGRKLWDD
jgi:type 1 fimbriae regulatory protein FimE